MFLPTQTNQISALSGGRSLQPSMAQQIQSLTPLYAQYRQGKYNLEQQQKRQDELDKLQRKRDRAAQEQANVGMGIGAANLGVGAYNAGLLGGGSAALSTAGPVSGAYQGAGYSGAGAAGIPLAPVAAAAIVGYDMYKNPNTNRAKKAVGGTVGYVWGGTEDIVEKYGGKEINKAIDKFKSWFS